MNGANVEKVYRQCHKREVDRERKWRKSKRYGNVRNVVHLCDFENAEAAEESPSWLSDNEAGVEQIVAACDGDGGESRYTRCVKKARERLRRAHPELVEVFNLIVQNGSNRKESIWRMMSRDRPNG